MFTPQRYNKFIISYHFGTQIFIATLHRKKITRPMQNQPAPSAASECEYLLPLIYLFILSLADLSLRLSSRIFRLSRRFFTFYPLTDSMQIIFSRITRILYNFILSQITQITQNLCYFILSRITRISQILCNLSTHRIFAILSSHGLHRLHRFY